MKREAIKKFKKMYESTLTAGFPYEDISRIEKELEIKILK